MPSNTHMFHFRSLGTVSSPAGPLAPFACSQVEAKLSALGVTEVLLTLPKHAAGRHGWSRFGDRKPRLGGGRKNTEKPRNHSPTPQNKTGSIGWLVGWLVPHPPRTKGVCLITRPEGS